MNNTVYHATSDDNSFEVVNSFRNGIKTSLAQGYGQGSGFYVWTTKEAALNHIEAGFTNKPYPVIISIQAKPNPKEWDIDYEVNYPSAALFLKNNIQILQELAKNKGIQIEGVYLTNASYNEFIGKDGNDYSSVGLEWSNGSTQGIGVGKDTFEESASIQDAKIVGSIINVIQQKYPDIVNAWEQRVLDFFLKNGQSTALKYIGQQDLHPSKIEIFVNNNWIDATNQNPAVSASNNSSNLPNKDQIQTQQPMQTQEPKLSYFLNNYIGKLGLVKNR